MAPEHPPSVVIFDARIENGHLRGSCEYIEPGIPGTRLQVRWAVESQPEGFAPIGGGVAYVYKKDKFLTVPVSKDASPIDEGDHRYRWNEGLNMGVPWVMFILILPPGYTLSQLTPAPAGARIFQTRLALYWVLRGDDLGRTQVAWTLSPLRATPEAELVQLNRLLSSPASTHEGSLAIQDANKVTSSPLNATLELTLSAGSEETGTKAGSIWKQPQLWVATIGAIAAIVVGYWQFGPHHADRTAAVSGRVSGQHGSINGAKVKLEQAGQPPQLQFSDSEGDFRFENVPEMQCSLRVEASGYDPYVLQINPGASIFQEIHLTAGKLESLDQLSRIPITASSTTLNFDSEETNMPPQYVRADAYLQRFGISISDVSKGSIVVLQHDFATTSGGSAFGAGPSHNVLTQIACDGKPTGFTLGFDKPVSQVSFKRASLIAGIPNGITHPAWTVCAFKGTEKVGCKSERLLREFFNVPDQEFALEGQGITSVRFDSDLRLDGKPFAAFCGVLIQSIALTR